MQPPRARAFLGLGEPGFDIADGHGAVGPMAVLALIRRVDDAGYMTGTGDHELDRTAEQLRAEEHRLGRCDVILARCQAVDRNDDVAEIDGFASKYHLAISKLVLGVEFGRASGR